MKLEQPYKAMFSCGTHVHGHGLVTARDGTRLADSSQKVFSRGVVVTMPYRSGDPYTVLDEENFTVLEVQEAHINQLP